MQMLAFSKNILISMPCFRFLYSTFITRQLQKQSLKNLIFQIKTLTTIQKYLNGKMHDQNKKSKFV